MKPSLGYFLCHATRSGSGVLGDTLWRTGLAGRPDQYFYDRSIESYSRRWDVTDVAGYLDAVLERTTTPNGVFGIRLTVGNVLHLARRLERCGALDETAEWSAVVDSFARRLPALRYIWLRRRDKVRQAVSAWRLEHGGPPLRRAGEETRAVAAPFSYEGIEQIRRNYEAEDRAWAAFFEYRRIAPLTLCYEDDIETDVPATVRRVLEYLGIAIPSDFDIAVDYEKLADAESDRLVGLFREVEAARPRPARSSAASCGTSGGHRDRHASNRTT